MIAKQFSRNLTSGKISIVTDIEKTNRFRPSFEITSPNFCIELLYKNLHHSKRNFCVKCQRKQGYYSLHGQEENVLSTTVCSKTVYIYIYIYEFPEGGHTAIPESTPNK